MKSPVNSRLGHLLSCPLRLVSDVCNHHSWVQDILHSVYADFMGDFCLPSGHSKQSYWRWLMFASGSVWFCIFSQLWNCLFFTRILLQFSKTAHKGCSDSCGREHTLRAVRLGTSLNYVLDQTSLSSVLNTFNSQTFWYWPKIHWGPLVVGCHFKFLSLTT